MKRLIYLLLLPIVFVSCGDNNIPEGPTQNTENANANIAGADLTVTRLEIPHLNSKYDYICHKLFNGDVNYTIEYDKKNYHARWVAYTYDSKNSAHPYSRTDAWAPEPFYSNDKTFQLSTNSFPYGYQRGHICGSAERLSTIEANQQTFYMSNMSPMLANFNEIYWGAYYSKHGFNGIETIVRDWGRSVTNNKSIFKDGTLYVVKGGTIDKNLGYIKSKNTYGDEIKMVIPQYYWIACLFVGKEGSARSIGFYFEHKDYKTPTKEFEQNWIRTSACSIDDLEKKTGIDFFCNLKDNIENIVESSYNISQWPGL